MTYRFPLDKLPVTIAGRADADTYLGMALLFGLEEAMAVFNVDLERVMKTTDAVRCLGDAVETANIGTRPRIEGIASLARSVLSCIETVAGAMKPGGLPGPAKVVLGIIGSGLGRAIGRRTDHYWP